MIHLANLGSQSFEKGHSFFEKRSVTADLATVIASIATGALIGAAIAVAASTSIGLTIGHGSTAGAIIGIAIVALRRFHPGMTNNKVQYPPVVKSDAFPNLNDFFVQVASRLNFNDVKAFSEVSQGCNGVVSVINEQRKKAVEGVAFGKEQWLEFFGLDIGVEPILPRDIVEILDGPCPTDSTKKVRDTHMLTLIPKGQTLKSLGELVKKRFSSATGYRYIYPPIFNQLSKPNDKSYWALMTRDVLGGQDLINGTRGKTKEEQNDKFTTLSEDGKANYDFPTVLEAVASILAHEARFGERLFSDNPLTYTRCQEMDGWSVVVGGFGSAGLRVPLNYVLDCIGASGVWRCRPAEVPVIGPW